MSRKEYLGLLSAAVFAGFAGGAFSSQAFSPAAAFAQKSARQPKTVIAEEFKLVDGQGRRRAELWFQPNGSGPQLELFDETGQRRVSIGCFGRGSSFESSWVSLENHDGTADAGLEVGSIGEHGEGRASVTVRRGRPEVLLQGGVRTLRADQEVSLEVSPAFDLGTDRLPRRSSLSAKDGNQLHSQLELGVSTEGPSITLGDADGKDRAVLGAVSLEKPDGSQEIRSPASLVFFAKDRKVIWSAPR